MEIQIWNTKSENIFWKKVFRIKKCVTEIQIHNTKFENAFWN